MMVLGCPLLGPYGNVYQYAMRTRINNSVVHIVVQSVAADSLGPRQ